MSFDQSSFTSDMLKHPSLLASKVIDALESTDTQYPVAINDPMNSLVMLLMADTHLYSKFTEMVDDKYSYLYRQRARNSQQLFTNLSEYDYVKLFASPVTVPFVFAMSADWIIANAVYYDENNNRIQIPSSSTITVGGVVYSMYYPIDILVNRNTGAISAFYNTSVIDPLYTLTSNTNLNAETFTKDGINWFRIRFDMFQFTRTDYPTTVSTGQGFKMNLSYNDQFYAIKVAQQLSDGTWSDLPICLSELYYDYQTPTAIVSLFPDSQMVSVTIPQIYFTNNQVNKNIRVQLYSTKGAVNYSISASDILSRVADFKPRESVWSAPLDKMPSYEISPTIVDIAGGSDAMSYAQMRDAIINNRLHQRAAITNQELIQAAISAGFTGITKVADDLTDRMYMVSNVLKSSDGLIVPTLAGSILLTADNLAGDPNTILSSADGYHTVLPTTVFKLPSNSTVCVPMSTAEVNVMGAMSKAELVAELNKGIYLRQPFHIVLLTDPKNPAARLYNLMNPSVTSLTFKKENAHSAPQMSTTAIGVIHRQSGTAGYLINFALQRSLNIENLDASNLSVILTCKDKVGVQVYLPATFVVSNSGSDIWQIALSTSYRITSENYISVVMYDENDQEVTTEIQLDQTFNVIVSFKTSYDTTVPKDSFLNSLLPPTLQSGSTVMSYQETTISFGKNLSDSIYTGVNTTWGNDVYETATDTIYHTTSVPTFQMNENGVINTKVNQDSSVTTAIIYNIGDTPSDTGDIYTKTSQAILVPNSGSTTKIYIDDVTGFLAGMPVRGPNIPVGSTVQSVGSNFIVISTVITAALDSGSDVIGTNVMLNKRTTTAQSEAGILITVASTADLLVGVTVYGIGIPGGKSPIATIESPTTFTIASPTLAPLPNNTLLTFINRTTHGVVKVAKGEIVRDENGSPIVVKAAQNQYNIPTILFDGRLFASEKPLDIETTASLYSYLENWANQISTMDDGLIENSSVYYKPTRTMGNATFGKGNSVVASLPLTLAFTVYFYVPESVYNDDNLRTNMETTTISTINTSIQGNYIDIAQITEDIKKAIGNSDIRVEMGGINNDDSLKLLSLSQTDTTTSVEQILVLQPDNTIDRVPNITISFIPKPV